MSNSRSKVNPRRRPATQADVEKAKREATVEAMRRVLYLILFLLIDKHGALMEDIQQLAKEVNEEADSVASGEIKWKDIEWVVEEEYDVHLPW